MRTPALTAWRAELKAGQRTVHDSDALWQAACADIQALEMDAAGLPGIRDRYLADAHRILCAAIKDQEGPIA